jgi:hypothetical protein
VATVVELRVDDWPWSTAPGDDEAVGATGAVLTTTVAAAEIIDTPALSVACSSKDHIPTTDDALVGKE